MAIFKCKMCGGALEINEDITVAECEYCGSKQTVPSKKDEVVTNLFNRANNLRLKNEFDKAAEIYNKILNENDADAEAHWGLVLCKYGIEYVEDPKTYKRIPTCHRTQYTSVLSDADYLATIENADAVSKEVYAAEAKEIAELQKSILAIVKDEKPFDVFICYKETDENGKRTVDSSLANDIYYQLEKEGLRVFYAAITLEDKLGVEYEPYIFAALNSAKVMLAIGTKPEYFNAVWVKNEWSRYLGIMKTDREKMLIPCYRDMDAYDLPEEFAHLQAQDMSKIGFINDLVRGIKKVTAKDEPKADVIRETVVTEGAANITPLLERVFMFLEDSDWKSANEYCEKVLDIDPKNTQAYLGKLLSELRVRKQEDLKNCGIPFDGNSNYEKIFRFGDENLKNTLSGYIKYINQRNEENRLSEAYSRAKNHMTKAETEQDFKEAAGFFEKIKKYKDSADLAKVCREKAETVRKDAILDSGKTKMESNTIADYEEAIKILSSVSGWKDADEKVLECKKRIDEITKKEEAERLERERKAQEALAESEARKKKSKKLAMIITPIACALVAVVILLNTVIIPNSKYNAAVVLMNDGKYTEAIETFETLDGYKDSIDKIDECKTANKKATMEKEYNYAISLMEEEKFEEAIVAFKRLKGYLDYKDKIKNNAYEYGIDLMNKDKFIDAIKFLRIANDYKDSKEKLYECFNKISTKTISSSVAHSVAIKNDGTVISTVYTGEVDAGQCNVSSWTDIIAVSANESHTVGLKSDGTVIATEFLDANSLGRCDVSAWRNIKSISAGYGYTVGLKVDGTVVATEYTGSAYKGQCDVADWKDIVAISAGYYHTVGLQSDGTVVAVGLNDDGQCDVGEWTDIIAVSAGYWHTVGLKSDGSVVVVGYSGRERANVSAWKDIVAVSASFSSTVGLKSDGTVVATGSNLSDECNVSDWKNIVAISASQSHTIGLRSDGTVVAVGDNDDGQCDVSEWKNIKLNR